MTECLTMLASDNFLEFDEETVDRAINSLLDLLHDYPSPFDDKSVEKTEERVWKDVLEELFNIQRRQMSLHQLEQMLTTNGNKRESEITLDSSSPLKKKRF